jgi:septal ring factor EnvC (AmiA/AmiB activator)
MENLSLNAALIVLGEERLKHRMKEDEADTLKAELAQLSQEHEELKDQLSQMQGEKMILVNDIHEQAKTIEDLKEQLVSKTKEAGNAEAED